MVLGIFEEVQGVAREVGCLKSHNATGGNQRSQMLVKLKHQLINSVMTRKNVTTDNDFLCFKHIFSSNRKSVFVHYFTSVLRLWVYITGTLCLFLGLDAVVIKQIYTLSCWDIWLINVFFLSLKSVCFVFNHWNNGLSVGSRCAKRVLRGYRESFKRSSAPLEISKVEEEIQGAMR